MKGGPMGGLLKQVQKMQQEVLKAQEELADIVAEATAGGGMVTVKANGKNEVLEIRIRQEVVDPEDVEMLEDLVLAAVNEALSKVSKAASDHMAKAAGPLQSMLPPGLNLPGM